MDLVELDLAVREGEQGPVAADADVLAGVQLAAALTNDDVTGDDGLAAKFLYAETFRVALATVGGRACTFFMRYVICSPLKVGE